MKKLTFIMTCCIGLLLMASCKKNIVPTINILENGCVTENAQVFSGDEIMVGFQATGHKLTKIEVTITQNDVQLAQDIKNIETETYTYTQKFTIDASGTVVIRGTVTDAAGQTATASFNVIYNEKPYAKFLGNYEGNALSTGFSEVTLTNFQPMHQDFTDREIPVNLTIFGGETMNDVIALLKIHDEEVTVTGTVEGDKITFSGVDIPFTMTYDLNGLTLSPTIFMTYDITTTLVDGKLFIDGTCTGNGEINTILAQGTLNMESTIGGSLNKVR